MTSPSWIVLMESRRDSNLEFPELEDIHLQTHSRTFVAIIVLFAAIVFAGLFFLCPRWICRSSRRPLPRSLRATPRRPRGLARSTIDGLPVSVVGNGGDVEAGECSICLGDLEDGDKVKVLPECRHYYHCECVDRWLRSQSTCPVCRASLRVDSEPPKIITQ